MHLVTLRLLLFFCFGFGHYETSAGTSVTVPGVGSYTLHRKRSYRDAVRKCKAEGAYLAVINTKAEEDVLMDLLRGKSVSKVFVGLNDREIEGFMVTALGESWASVGYSRWAPGEPDDAGNREDCVVIESNRLMKDVRCELKIPYVCEKNTTYKVSLNTDTYRMTPSAESSYTNVPNVGSYKLHVEGKTYSEATKVCISEGAHLAVINSKTEQDALDNLFEGTQSTEAYIGINDIAVEGQFVTVFDEPILSVGFHTWAAGEPRHSNGMEDCVVLKHDRTVAVRECGDHVAFICEKTIGCPALSVDQSMVVQCESNNDKVDCAEKTKPGTVATMTCAQGYAHESGQETFVVSCHANNTWSDSFTKCERNCGVSSALSDQANVTGGRPVRAGVLPWHVGIFKLVNGTYEHLCGGTLVTSHLVVTAAHCFWNELAGSAFNTSLFHVLAGQSSISWDKPKRDTQKREVAELILPDRFTGKIHAYQSDVALVRLSHPVEISKSVNVICVDWSNQLAFDEENGTVAGWGLNENMTKSESLMALQMALLPFKQCWDKYINNPSFRQYITSDKLCASWTGRGTPVCPGDSGGGLVFPKATKIGDRYFLRGIVSVGPTSRAGQRCNIDNVAVFTDIAAHLPFLKQHVKP